MPRPSERSWCRWLLALSVAATLHALLYVPLISPHRQADSGTYLAAAHAILHGSYTTPLAASFEVTPQGPADRTLLRLPKSTWQAPERQTFRTPGYPLLLAAVGGGAGGVSEGLLFVVQALLMGGAVWLLGLVVHRIAGARVALVAAVLYAIDPYSKRYTSLVLTEQLATFLALLTAYAFVRAWEERTSARLWALAGAAGAALTLVRPIFVLAPVLLVVAALVGSRARLRAAAAAAVAAAVIIVPWVGWTTAVVGVPALATFTEGWTLLDAADGEGLGHTSTQVESTPAFTSAVASVHRFAPSTRALLTDPTAHPKYLERADSELRRLALHEYRRQLASHPGRVVWNFLYRSYYIWMVDKDWHRPSNAAALLALRLLDWITGLLALAGAALLFRRRTGRALVVFLLVYTAASAVQHSEARFGIPLRGLYLAFAAVALVAAWERVRHTRESVAAARA